MGTVEQLEDHRDRARRDVPDPPDAALVARALDGEASACAKLYRRHAVRLNRLAFRLAPRIEDADDLVQEAFAAAFDGLARLDRPESFGGWVRAILVRTAAKQLRRARIARRIGLSHDRPYDVALVVDDAAPTDVAVELRRIYGHLHRMPAGCGVALVLRRVEGMTIPEIAHHMGVSEGTVKRRIKRAQARLIEEAGR